MMFWTPEICGPKLVSLLYKQVSRLTIRMLLGHEYCTSMCVKGSRGQRKKRLKLLPSLTYPAVLYHRELNILCLSVFIGFANIVRAKAGGR